MQRLYAFLRSCLLAIAVLSFVTTVAAQERTLSRNLEAVVVQGSTLSAFAGVNIDELFAYAYDFETDQWTQITFQFDEKDTANNYFAVDDGLLDANDEFLFMAKDAGDKATTEQWISDVSAQSNPRIEISVDDPLAPGEMAWVYLFQSATLAIDAGAPDYVSREAGAGLGDDRVSTPSYQIIHGENGLPVGLSIADGENYGPDLLDVFKLRAQIQLGFTISFTESFIAMDAENNDRIDFVDGRIRVLRRLDATILLLGEDFVLQDPFIYYPNSFVYALDIPDISSRGATLLSGRLSFDLTSNALGMQFVSANNTTPISVDGVNDDIDKSINQLLESENNWSYIGGSQGTIVHLFPLQTNVGGQRLLYYKDSSTNDAQDTGDLKSFADTGIDVTGGIVPPVRFSYIGYYLSGDLDSSIGPEIAANERSPFAVTSESQQYQDPTFVDESPVVPERFELGQNYPNPFNPTTQISYRISDSNATTVLRIFDVLGNEVRTLVDDKQPAGAYTVTWDGTDNSGRRVVSGIYFYRLQSGDFFAVRKLVMVK